mgnify:CR=1 FL=1
MKKSRTGKTRSSKVLRFHLKSCEMSKQLMHLFENEETNNFNFVYESVYSIHWKYNFGKVLKLVFL